MKNLNEYYVINAQSAKDLKQMIEQKKSEGFKPLDGIFIIRTPNGFYRPCPGYYFNKVMIKCN